jgi:membrane associated rhomboid family serine protease
MLFPFRDNVPTRHTPVATFGLIAVNVAAFLWMVGLPKDKQEELLFRRGFIPARIGQLFHGRAIDVELPRGKITTPEGVFLQVQEVRLPPAPRQTAVSLLTYMFLHGGWLHLLGNMWFLWIFGNNVEDRLGPLLYLLLYLGGGLVALACQWVFAPNSTVPMIGASGAVATILGAYAVTWPHARVETLVFLLFFVTIIELPAMLYLGLWFFWQVLSAALSLGPSDVGSQGGVAFWAHVGGFLAGLLLMPSLNDLLCPRPTRPTSDL